MSTRPYTLYDLQRNLNILRYKHAHVVSCIHHEPKPSFEDRWRGVPKRSVVLDELQSIANTINDTTYTLPSLCSDYTTLYPADLPTREIIYLIQRLDRLVSLHGFHYPAITLDDTRLTIEDIYFTQINDMSNVLFTHKVLSPLRLLFDVNPNVPDLLHQFRLNKYTLNKSLHRLLEYHTSGYTFPSDFVQIAKQYHFNLSVSDATVQEIQIECILTERIISLPILPSLTTRLSH